MESGLDECSAACCASNPPFRRYDISMSDKENENELGLPALLTDAVNAVDKVAPSGWKLRLAKITAQLLVGSRQGAAVYATAREHLDEIEGRTAMNRALFAAATDELVKDPRMIERAKVRLIGDLVQKQDNLENIVGKADERVLLLTNAFVEPSSDTKHPNADNDDTAGRLDDFGPEDDSPLPEDWASSFTGVAENATSDELRDRLSRVLAGEILSPGTFPRAIVRSIAELERNDIEALLSVIPNIVFNLVSNTDGIARATMNTLADAGLIDPNEMMTATMTANISSTKTSGISGTKFGIIIKANADITVSFTGRSFTRLGRAVLSILDEFDERTSVINAVSRIDKSHIVNIIVGEIKSIDDNSMELENTTTVYPTPVNLSWPMFTLNPFTPS